MSLTPATLLLRIGRGDERRRANIRKEQHRKQKKRNAREKLLENIKVAETTGGVPFFKMKSSIEVMADLGKLFVYGGFDEDENLETNIYLLDIASNTWVTRPNVISREGHTANYIGNGNVIMFGGVPDDEYIDEFSLNNLYLNGSSGTSVESSASIQELQGSQLLVYNVSDHRWSIPRQNNPTQEPSFRSRHAACLSNDKTKLFISGGFFPGNTDLYDDLYCYDLQNGVWDGPRKFVKRFDHHLVYHNNKIWSFGGLDKNMNYINSNEINYFDLASNVTGKIEIYNLPKFIGDHVYLPIPTAFNSLGNSRFPTVLDVIIPLWSHSNSASPGYEISSPCISLLDVNDLKWRKVLFGNLEPLNKYVWRHVFISDGQLNMVGYPRNQETSDYYEFQLTHVVKIDLKQLGLRDEAYESDANIRKMSSILLNNRVKDSNDMVHSAAINSDGFFELGLDFAQLLDSEEFTDFEIVGVEGIKRPPLSSNKITFVEHDEPDKHNAFKKSKPLKVHLAVLASRWPYFRRMLTSGMNESTSRQLFIPEPISWLRAVIQYLYTGSIVMSKQDNDLYGILVLAHYYALDLLFQRAVLMLSSIPMNIKVALKLYCVSVEIDDCYILRKKALELIFNRWGMVVRSNEFAQLPKSMMLQLCGEFNENCMILGNSSKDTMPRRRSNLNYLAMNNDFNINNAVDGSREQHNRPGLMRHADATNQSRAIGVITTPHQEHIAVYETLAENTPVQASQEVILGGRGSSQGSVFGSENSGDEEDEDQLENIGNDNYYLYQQRLHSLGTSDNEDNIELEGGFHFVESQYGSSSDDRDEFICG